MARRFGKKGDSDDSKNSHSHPALQSTVAHHVTSVLGLIGTEDTIVQLLACVGEALAYPVTVAIRHWTARVAKKENT